MTRILKLDKHFKRIAEVSVPPVGETEVPSEEDSPPPEFLTERYTAWSATAIYGFVPFSSPPGR